MGKWSFQYWNGSAWTTLTNAELDHVLEELNGNEEAVLNLPNTSANRAIIASNVSLNVRYNGATIFPGLLTGAEYTSTNLQCYVYNPVFVALKQATAVLNRTYTGVAANSILADIVALTGGAVSAGSCPSTAISLTFTNANAFDAVVTLAKSLGLYYWGANGQINIGTRDATTYTPTLYEQGTKRGIDRSKQIGTVIVKGISNINGTAIQGSYGSSGAVKVFVDKKAADAATLNNLAAYKWQTLNNSSTGNPLNILTDTACNWHPGQYVTVNRPDLNLVGTLIIQRITKGPVLSNVEVDVATFQDDVNLQEMDGQTSDMAAYPIGASQVTGSLPTSQLSGSLNGFGVMTQGNDSAKPTAGVIGRIYWAVDTNKIYLDTGSSWQFIGSSVLGTLTGTISTSVLTGSLTGFATMSQGVDASKPSAGVAGRIYYATDTGKAYLDSGSSWILTGTPLLGNMNGAISAAQLAANAVTANAIAANAITASAIAASAISASHLSAGCVTANALAAGAITAAAIAANTITAAQITTAALTGLTLQTATSGNRIIMGSYSDSLGSQNSLGILGEQIRFYDQSAHYAGGLTASGANLILCGCPGYNGTGVFQLGAGTYVELVSALGVHDGADSAGNQGNVGASGQVLQSNGAGHAPSWVTPSSGYGQGSSPSFSSITMTGNGLYNSSGYQLIQGNASDWLRINQNQNFSNGIALYGDVSVGTGVLHIASWGGYPYLAGGGNSAVRVQTSYGYGDIGPQNGSYFHFTTDRPQFYFDHSISVNGPVQFYATGAKLYSSATGVIQVQDANGNLATLDTSNLFVDHINSASGAGITLFDYLLLNGLAVGTEISNVNGWVRPNYGMAAPNSTYGSVPFISHPWGYSPAFAWYSGYDNSEWMRLDSNASLWVHGDLWIGGAQDIRLHRSDVRVLQVMDENGSLATLDTSNLYVDHIMALSGGSIYFFNDIEFASSRNFYPYSYNSGNCGTNTRYWGAVYANYLEMHAANSGSGKNVYSFDHIDDLYHVKNYKVMDVESEPHPCHGRKRSGKAIDMEASFPFLLDEDGFMDMADFFGYSMGCHKASALKHDEHEKRFLALLDEIESLKGQVKKLK